MRNPKGFSLIELLVVIAIIAILAAILFPIFIKARESGKKAVCTSNMKQIYSALVMYADDNNGCMPPHPDNHGVADWSEQWRGFAPLYKYTRKDRVFVCPLARKYGTTAAEKAKRALDPEPIYTLYTDNGKALFGSYHFWPQVYMKAGSTESAKLDTDLNDKSLCLWQSFPNAAPTCVKLRGPVVDSFLHRLGDGGNGVLCLSLKGDVKFLPVNGYPFY